MRLTSCLFVAAIAAAGCGKKPGGDCAAAAGAADRVVAEKLGHMSEAERAAPAVKARADKMAEGYRKVISARCAEDHWSADMIACMAGGQTTAELEACRAKLTPEQLKNMDEAMRQRKDEMVREVR